ncbi:Ethylmalonyl-CoA mutase, methylsuccinyl-CoA-forming [hydrothermal vent metagenome]|uniref:Ethylmalonyl-CoA mutase, methylsuccinyl-CoA-forming n=1 Tax=hydrothermal vent metagenome TaxID=652676 RepID=A0A3B0R6C8_9ZZZZ
MSDLKKPEKDRPWLFRTYSGHSSAAASNELYRTNLKKGQTGLSVAFDLPTQTGYDSDHILARGEVGKVGVPICHLGDMRTLFKDIPLAQMNTSMTINAPSPWLLALYVAAAEEQGAARADLSGTVQNDIIKEYLSRGTYIFPPEPSMRLITDVISFTYKEIPRWNPTNVCSYHLQEAGATPTQELAFALATSIAVLDAIRAGGQVAEEDFPKVVGRISFFVNAGLRFVTEIAKMRAFVELWDEITRERYGVTDPKYRRFRYGVQVNSLGLTEQQPENNVYRIMIEMLAVVLSKNARARAVQLPAWNEALGLPRPWDQQWSLRLQQIMAMETDLLEYGDIFEGSTVMAEKVESLKAETRAEIKRIEDMGGAIAAVESSYMKNLLVAANSARLQGIESGEQTVVGVNAFVETAPSPLMSDGDGGIMTVDPKAEAQQIARLNDWRKNRDDGAVAKAIADLKAAAESDRNIMEPSIAAAKAGVTTGEWGQALREVFGEYRAPTGVGGVLEDDEKYADIRAKIDEISQTLGGQLRFLVGKPGLDGHSNGAEQIAVRAAQAGMAVFYDGIRLTPAEIVSSALEHKVHAVGLSILSGSHIPLVRQVMDLMDQAGLSAVPVVVGGIIPKEDEQILLDMGVARIYTPKNYQMTDIMADVADMVGRRHNSYPF